MSRETISGVLAGEPGECPRVEGVPSAVGGDHHSHAYSDVAAAFPDGVEDEVGERGDPAEPGGVPARVDLDLQPPRTVVLVILRGLTHQPAYVVLGAQHRARDVVEPLEPEPALLVGPRKLRRPVLHQGFRQAMAVTLGELEQGSVSHGPGEM